MKILILVLSLFIFPLNFTSRGTDFYLEKVNEAYSSYRVDVDEENENYKLSIITGICNDSFSYGVFFEPAKNSSLILVCKMNDEIYEFPTSSDKSIWIVAIKYDSEATIILYDTKTKTSSSKLSIQSETYNNQFDYQGLSNGSEVSSLKSMNDRFNTQVTLYIVCGVVVTICIIILLAFKATHSGLFSKTRRTSSTFNMKDFLQSTPEEKDPYDPVSDVEVAPFVESSQEQSDESIKEEILKKTAKEHLMDKGYVVDYSLLSEEEKDKVMLELMLLKNNGEITEEEYKKETIELWRK